MNRPFPKSIKSASHIISRTTLDMDLIFLDKKGYKEKAIFRPVMCVEYNLKTNQIKKIWFELENP